MMQQPEEQPKPHQPAQRPPVWRAPTAPTAPGEAHTWPRMPVAVPGTQRETQTNTQPSVDTVHPDETLVQPAPPRQWLIPERAVVRRYVTRRPVIIGAGAAALAAVLACAGGILVDRAFFNQESYNTTPIGSTSGNLSGPEYACAPATDKGGFPNGTTIDTRGTGGAIVDDTQQGQQTQVAVIPGGQDVHLNGAVHEWVFSTGCTPAQIEQQAKNHASSAGATYLSDWHSLRGLTDTEIQSYLAGKIPALDARTANQIHDRISQRSAYRQAKWWQRPFMQKSL